MPSGLSRTYQSGNNNYSLISSCLRPLFWIVEFPKAVVWALFFFSYMLLDCLQYWQSISLKYMRMWMTRNCIFSFKPDSSNSHRKAIKVIEECIAEVRIWMISHQQLTNDTKTEVFIIGSYQQLSKVSIESIAVGTSVIKPVECVRNLGAWSPQ